MSIPDDIWDFVFPSMVTDARATLWITVRMIYRFVKAKIQYSFFKSKDFYFFMQECRSKSTNGVLWVSQHCENAVV
jgi:hypothetical protein